MSKRFERCESNAFAIYDNVKQITINCASIYECERLMEILDEFNESETCARCGQKVIVIGEFEI